MKRVENGVQLLLFDASIEVMVNMSIACMCHHHKIGNVTKSSAANIEKYKISECIQK